MKKRRKTYKKPTLKACDIKKLNAKAKEFCARAGEKSALGQRRCLKKTRATLLRVVPGCRGLK